MISAPGADGHPHSEPGPAELGRPRIHCGALPRIRAGSDLLRHNGEMQCFRPDTVKFTCF